MSNPNFGTKVTDPKATSLESSGPIASDSLAAESVRAGGKFSQNKDSAPLSVKGSNSTFANEDTSGATRLDPASDAETRKAEEDWAEEKKLGAASSTSYQNAKTGRQGDGKGEEAPSYVNAQFVDKKGPKGKGLTEGGFEGGDYKNASFNGEIGGKNDPGREAEKRMFASNAKGDGLVGVAKQEGGLGENTFETLERDTDA